MNKKVNVYFLSIFFAVQSMLCKIEKVEDLNKIGVFSWNAKVFKNINALNEIDLLLKSMSSADFLKQASNGTIWLLEELANNNPSHFVVKTLVEKKTELSIEKQEEWQSKYYKGIAWFYGKGLGAYFTILGTVYYGKNLLQYFASQYIQPWWDRRARYKEFISKLSVQKIKQFDADIVFYPKVEKYWNRVMEQFAQQIKTGKFHDMEGCLLFGEPGNGKTTLVKWLAYKTGLKLVTVNVNDLIDAQSGTVNEGLKWLFEYLRDNSPCICFFDELDIFSKNPEIMNQLGQELDGMSKNKGIFMVGATNYKETIRPSLLRPGRFGVHIEIENPSHEQIVALIKLYTKVLNVSFSSDISVDVLANQLLDQKFSCSSTKSYIEFLARVCERNNTKIVTLEFIQEANEIYKFDK